MSYPLFEALILFKSDVNLNFPKYCDTISHYMGSQQPLIDIDNNHMRIEFEEIVLDVYHESHPDVLVESKEIAQDINSPHSKEIAQCTQRFSITGTGDDDATDYFNDFFLLVEVAMELGSCWHIHPSENKILEFKV